MERGIELMDLPQSQVENARPSGLKQPSRLPGAGRPLLETSQSELNTKTARDGTMPPPSTTIKHKISGLPEPPPKRKTLAERAGEPLNPLRSHMLAPARPAVPRSDSTLAQVGTRPASSHIANGYRNLSNASTVGSTDTGIRPPSRQNGGRAPAVCRPPSAADSRSMLEDETEMGIMGKRKGTPILSFHSPPENSIRLRKTRGQSDLRKPSPADIRTGSGSYARSVSTTSGGSASDGGVGSTRDLSSGSSNGTRDSRQHEATVEGTRGQSMRNVSTSTLNIAFADLSLSPEPQHRSTSHSKHRPSLSLIKEEPVISPSKIPKFSCTPSLRHTRSAQCFQTPIHSPVKQKPSLSGLATPVTSARRKAVDIIPVFLTKEKLTPISSAAWDLKGRLEDMEQSYTRLRSDFASADETKKAMEEKCDVYKVRAQELVQEKKDIETRMQDLKSTNRTMSADLEKARNDLHASTTDLRQARRDHERDMQEVERKHERQLSELYSQQENESRRLERELEKIAEQGEREIEEAKRAWERKKDEETAELTTQHWEEIEEMKTRHQREIDKLEQTIKGLEQKCESRASESASEVQALRDSLAGLQGQLDLAKSTQTTLRSQISAAEARTATLEQEKTSLVSKTHFLEGNQEAQSLEFTSMSEKLQDAINAKDATLDSLRKEEMLRRKLNATILELRGNIRVFIRIRPLLSGEEEPSKVDYPDAADLDGGKELLVHAPTTLSATGKERSEKHAYAFDRVFGPETANMQVFEDCRELIQSVVDGYNVSILSYGQTGSGKTFGMSGPDGIIPCSISLLLSEMQRLQEKGWEYQVEASFVEVYNETLNDLLGDAKTWDDAEDLNASVRAGGKKKEKHEIHHDSVTGKTTVANLSSVTLWPPPEDEGSWPPPAPLARDSNHEINGTKYTEQAVKNLLDTAAKNRRVAATKSNERSSRSHSVFILKLKGCCAISGESSEGILNLVDLAGSERLKQSGAEGDRKKETQAINKSLSSLGDVIAALGNRKGDESQSHIPYRNSKLTYLLQSSLGGTTASGKSSRTLMMLHLSPLQAHWQESRSSLLFGSKVHGTHIGTAKKK